MSKRFHNIWHEIDDIVYRLFNLEPDEITLIENAISETLGTKYLLASPISVTSDA